VKVDLDGSVKAVRRSNVHHIPSIGSVKPVVNTKAKTGTTASSSTKKGPNSRVMNLNVNNKEGSHT